MTPTRRGFLRAGLSLGILGSAAGCIGVPTGPGGTGGGGGLGRAPTPGEFAWQGPPQRSNTIAHSEIGGSIQDAFDSLTPDSTLVLDTGPYSETAELPATNSITIAGNGNTRWSNPGGERRIVDSPNWSTETTAVQGSLQEGATTLSVGDASIFAAGDDVHLQDPTDVYQGMTDEVLNETNNQYKGELAIVASVDRSNDTITLNRGVHQHYDNARGALEISAIEWGMTDVHITGITFEGGVRSGWRAYSGTEMYALALSQIKNLWLTNLTADGFHGDLAVIGTGRNTYVEECHVHNIGRYGISFEGGHTHGRVRNVTAGYIDPEDSGYIVQCGGGSKNNTHSPAPTYDIQAVNCGPVETTANWLYDAHFGAERVVYSGGVADTGNTGIGKLRGTDQHIRGGSYGPLPEWAVQSNQVIRNCSVKEVTARDGGFGWTLWPKEGHEVQNVTMADCQWVNMDRDPFYFRSTNSGNPPPVSNLQVINSSWNGEWIDDAMIRACQGFDSSTIDFTTSYPPMSPAEYFSANAGSSSGGGAQNESA